MYNILYALISTLFIACSKFVTNSLQCKATLVLSVLTYSIKVYKHNLA